jgi:hypothetical protein
MPFYSFYQIDAVIEGRVQHLTPAPAEFFIPSFPLWISASVREILFVPFFPRLKLATIEHLNHPKKSRIE